LLVELAAGRVPNWRAKDDSEGLFASAVEHRMTGLLWSAAEAIGLPKDHDLSARLADLDLRNWARQSVLRNGLIKVSRLLDRHGIQAAVLKGIPAEDRWYGRTGERPSRDIDLLLGPQHLKQVDDVVEALQADHVLVGHAQRLVNGHRLPEVELWVENVPIDLHFDLLGLGPFGRDPQAAWDHLVLHDLGSGATVPVLDAEISLVNFVLHLNRDNFRRLLGFADVIRVLRAELIQWEMVEQFVAAEGIQTLFDESLRIVHEELQTSPVNVARPTTWRTRMHRRLWRPQVRLLGNAGLAEGPKRQFWQPFLVRGGVLSAMRWWLKRLLPPPALVRYYRASVSDEPISYLRVVVFDRLNRLISGKRALLPRRMHSR
jgi:hypothetical protein